MSITPITSIFDALPEDSPSDAPIGFSAADTPIRFAKCTICGQNISISSYDEHVQTHQIYKAQSQQQDKFSFPKESALAPLSLDQYAQRKNYELENLLA